jgi:hypothetical protein
LRAGRTVASVFIDESLPLLVGGLLSLLGDVGVAALGGVLVLGGVVADGGALSDGLMVDCGCTGDVCAVVVASLPADGLVVGVVLVVASAGPAPVAGCGGVGAPCDVGALVLSLVACAYT